MKITEIYSQIPHCYVDMDGVVANCEKSAAEFNGVSVPEFISKGFDSLYWKNVMQNADIEEFFGNLEKLPNANKLLGWLLQHNIDYTFLTRPVREPNTSACIRGKLQWLAQKGLSAVPVIFEIHKEKYAESNSKPNILIDDQADNINKWKAAGGIGLLYTDESCNDILRQLTEIYELKTA